MQCPVCEVTLVISSREGIEIDHCPDCRGVWLDRGELDKIIDRSRPSRDRDRDRERDDRDRGYRDDDRYRDDRYRDDRSRDDREYKRKKRRGFLEDLFDFD
jgi:Zn-finger nucleic acid-binding protein